MFNFTNDQGNAILFFFLITFLPNKLAKIKKFKTTRVEVYVRDTDTFILSLARVYNW